MVDFWLESRSLPQPLLAIPLTRFARRRPQSYHLSAASEKSESL